MEFDTVELGAGSYPDGPIEEKMQTVKVECRFITYIQVPEKYTEYDDISHYINENCDQFDLLEEADSIEIVDII